MLSGDARRAVFAPLDDGSLRSEAVVRRVGSAIALGLLGNGERLPTEADLAVQLNVSTGTLREALGDLRRLGLVETRRGRAGGSFARANDDALAALADARLADLGTSDLRELGDVHAGLAGTAARLAAMRASQHEIARLREIVDHLAAAGPVTTQRRVDGRFYIEVAACAQSVRMTMLEMELHVELGQLPWAPARAPHLLEQIVARHRSVVDAIEARDAQTARAVAEQHVAERTAWSIELRLQGMQARTAVRDPSSSSSQEATS